MSRETPRGELSRRSLLLGLGLGLETLVIAGGCRQEVEVAPRAPLRVGLGVAPVVADDPWVVAFLTEISIARPPGADARLEGRASAGGLRHPDAIIEGETRKVLAELLAAYERKRPRDPRLAPAWQADPLGPEARVRWRLVFVDRNQGFVTDDHARASLGRDGQGPHVRVHLGDEQSARLAELSAALVDRRLAVTLADEVLMLPVVASAITGGEIQLFVRDRQDPEAAAAALLERLTR